MAEKVLKTAGELKKALKGIPDDTPLAIDNHGRGWGLKPPFLAEYEWQTTEHSGYYTAAEAKQAMKDPKKAHPEKLDHPVCVLEPGIKDK